MNKLNVKANSIFNSVAGDVTPDNVSEEYLNYRKCWEKYPQEFILRDMPLHLDIEASSRCNLNCSFCDKRPLLKKGQIGDIDFDLFKSIVDQFDSCKLWGMKLSYRGEPLCNPKVAEMVEYAKKKGVLDVYFNTNGLLLTATIINDLIDAHLDRISISVDGVDKESYESVRIGGDFDTLVRNLKLLKKIKKQRNVTFPKVRIQTVILPNTDKQLYKDTWTEYADEIAMLDLKDEKNRDETLTQKWACPQLWQRMTIEWDGTIFGCNNDDLRELQVGNVNEKSIYDCWHDEKLMQARQLHSVGDSYDVHACKGCPLRTTQIMTSKNGK